MITAETIIERLQALAAEETPTRGTPGGILRGDHDLNPGMQAEKDLTPAAVLVPLVIRGGGLTTLFTQRTEHLLHHAGQISFPGGHAEPGDATAEETALRETEEEVGMARAHITTIGRLNQYVTRTGFSITPVVALVTPPFDINPDADEVDAVFEVPLDFLLDPTNHQRHRREFKGQIREFYAMPYEDYYIWGATAGMLVNLYEVLRDT